MKKVRSAGTTQGLSNSQTSDDDMFEPDEPGLPKKDVKSRSASEFEDSAKPEEPVRRKMSQIQQMSDVDEMPESEEPFDARSPLRFGLFPILLKRRKLKNRFAEEKEQGPTDCSDRG